MAAGYSNAIPSDELRPLLSRQCGTISYCGVVVHRTRQLTARDVRRVVRPAGTTPPCTTPARSIVDAASWDRTDREAITLVAMSFQQRLVTLAEIRAVLNCRPRAKRRRLVWLTAADAAGGSEALGELDVLVLLRAARLPAPTRNAERTDAAGRRRYLDLFFDEWQLQVEIDGGHHLDVRHAWADN